MRFTIFPNTTQRILIVLVIVGVVPRGIAYSDASSPQISFVDGIVPGGLWGAVWFAIAVALFVSVFVSPLRRFAVSAASSIWLLWTLSYFVSWMTSETAARSWLTASTMASLGGILFILAAAMGASKENAEPVQRTT